ncbi:hydrogen peroxide-inducible genes activator [Candidatus Magnetaquicoccus inordinatus]|uniref:hydrogen peroxide-inducible genes activator n=1 Tax=Candidatus Magnetaquicoccus inordinatus TaxID=2496818 RepID=UPI00102CB09E|nr:hydrogen peroxide-inducible genes activator [Candidatus Magnetaquicoccus inordinatus]
MNLRQLEYALAVARERNFIRAAQLCHVSQPSLSVAVKALEEELGVPLFERGRGEIKVTRQGQRVLEQMRTALEEVEQIRRLARSGLDPLTGSLRVGAIFTVGPYLYPGLSAAFHAQAPRMKLLLEENYTAILTERLQRGELDAIIVALPFVAQGMEQMPLYDEPFVAAVPAGHPWEHRTDLQGEDLGETDLILLGKGHCFRDQVLDICPECMRLDEKSGRVQNIIEGTSLETLRHMVATGVGVSVLPLSSLKNLLCNLPSCPVKTEHLVRYIPFAEPVPNRRVVLVWRSSFPNQEAIDTLVVAVQQSLPQGTRALH